VRVPHGKIEEAFRPTQMPYSRPDTRDPQSLTCDALALAIDRLVRDNHLAEASALLSLATEPARVLLRLSPHAAQWSATGPRPLPILPAASLASPATLPTPVPVDLCRLWPA